MPRYISAGIAILMASTLCYFVMLFVPWVVHGLLGHVATTSEATSFIYAPMVVLWLAAFGVNYLVLRRGRDGWSGMSIDLYQ